MDEMVSQGVNGIVLSPYNDPLICDKINELNAREIPVITTNTDIENSSRLAYVAAISTVPEKRLQALCT